MTRLGLLIFALMLAISPATDAHRLDDLMQASFIEIIPGEIRIQLNLNPGVAVAEKLIWMIDRDGDGVISAIEAAAFSKTLQKQLKVSMDNQSLPLAILDTQFDAPSELRSGNGNIRLELRAPVPPLPSGVQRVRFENRNFPAMSAYLVNALIPHDPAIKIFKQLRNETQSICWIHFSIETPTNSTQSGTSLFRSRKE